MGDRAISGHLPGGLGRTSDVRDIEGNATQTEAYSEERVVDGKTIFLSPENAKTFDAAKDEGKCDFSVVTNGSGWDKVKDFLGVK